jgi:integrase
LRGKLYWIKFPKGSGAPIREPTGSRDRRVAERLLKTRVAEVANNKFKAKSKATIGDLVELAVKEQRALRRRSSGIVEARARKNVIPQLGNLLAHDLSLSRIWDYVESRRSDGAADATINRELSIVRRGLKLGIQEKIIDTAIKVPKLDESSNVRQGFLEHDEYKRLYAELPDGINLLLVVGYYLGNRLGELRNLKWSHVDLDGDEIHIPAALAKNKRARTVPIYGEMKGILEAAKAYRNEWWPDRDWVFIRRGKRIGGHLTGWREACARAGVPELRFHDLRRSAVRNMERAGIPRSVAMSITGHETDAMYRRYAIVAAADKRVAKERLEKFFENREPAGMGTKLGTVTPER